MGGLWRSDSVLTSGARPMESEDYITSWLHLFDASWAKRSNFLGNIQISTDTHKKFMTVQLRTPLGRFFRDTSQENYRSSEEGDGFGSAWRSARTPDGPIWKETGTRFLRDFFRLCR